MSHSKNPTPIREPWSGDPPQAAAARRRLLDATGRCIARDGLPATSIAAIAAEAGVSRQTVYRYFGGRDDLARHAILAGAEDLRSRIQAAIRPLEDPADMIVEALVMGLHEIRTDPILRAVWDTAQLDGSIVAGLTQPAGIEWIRTTLSGAVDAVGWGRDEADTRLEFTLRVFLSLFVSPLPERTPDEMRAFLYRHLIPGIGLGERETS